MQANLTNENNIQSLDLEKYQKLIDVVKQIVDLDTISHKILTDFKNNTEPFGKKFYKLAKKESDLNARLQFIKNYILPKWKEIESVDDILHETRKALPEREFLMYLSGIFIAIHSKNLKTNQLLECILAEMFMRSSQKILTSVSK